MRWCPYDSEDHPRLRGEKVLMGSFILFIMGSPPLTRGKGSVYSHGRLCYGITPAYAGKSSGVSVWTVICWDHPRLRGEKKSKYKQVYTNFGSPPLTRGKGASVRATIGISRITPAYAGKRLGR